MVKKILVGLAAFMVLVSAAFVITAPRGEDARQFAALSEKYEARIIRDAYGVPHIYGKRDIDVAFGLAYAHAEDDFETIQDVLLATRGKLATLRGPAAAKTDYLIAFMNVWDVVNEGYDSKLSQQARDHAEAYADGLNYYVSQNSGEVSPALLPVTGKDVVAGFTFKLPLFYGFDKAVAKVAAGTYGTGLDKTARFEVTDQPQPDIGSQGIAIAPHRSGDGSTRLLVNSHQPLIGAVAWYEARVKSEEGWDMAGGTFPGAPVILHGHGPTLGWANTVNKPDLVDVYELTINPENENQYLLDGMWRDFDVEDTAIDVTFLGPFRWTFNEPVYRSEHGPVFKTDKGAFAMRWAGMNEMRALDVNIAMNKARTQSDFEAALAVGAVPSLNYVYADKDGHIAHYYNAMMPLRLEGADWSGLLPGDRSDLIWRAYHPFERTPMTVNPPSGAVYNANNTPFVATDGEGAPKASGFTAAMGIQSNITNRALRISELIATDAEISADDLKKHKYDNLYAAGSVTAKAVQEMLSVDVGREYQAAQLHLSYWDLSTNADSKYAALGVLSSYPFVMADMRGEPTPDAKESLLAAAAFLMKHYDRLDPDWGEVNRLVRGDKDWALAGGPDILRAVYGELDEERGIMKMTAGDSYIMFVNWAADGGLTSRTIHSFGSATLDRRSQHYSDQAPLFAGEEERILPLTLDAVLAEKTRDYTVGSFVK
jgi:acyl-homoserine-lactone acylase